ncbi:DUF4386 domain-containing protein [Actinoplanes hulinensis]|uniref:DUF4386 domain-containing protein n=1 Tax=Actinoplanes hulinensis TaxID=1144547 RepID=A0ABS7BBW6_9ACTN|nr:DUF4386 domain-containing protein [Actinoplanes hulinensis]MBW6438423.1 DUF4386 domain-containing protein [Actinoplanes hulinensis]
MKTLHGVQNWTGVLLLASAAGFTVASSVLSATFDWPDILREPAPVVLASFHAGGPSLVWTWFAVAWTYALVGVPMSMMSAALGRGTDPALRTAGAIGAASALLSLIGFLRWVFVVPALAGPWAEGDAATRPALEAAWTAQHQFGGALLGEHLGQVLAIVWSATVSVVALRSGVLPRWIGWSGLSASALYLFNQGDVLATAVPGFPVWEPAGLIGSTAWGLWLAAVGVVLIVQRRGASVGSIRAARYAG